MYKLEVILFFAEFDRRAAVRRFVFVMRVTGVIMGYAMRIGRFTSGTTRKECGTQGEDSENKDFVFHILGMWCQV